MKFLLQILIALILFPTLGFAAKCPGSPLKMKGLSSLEILMGKDHNYEIKNWRNCKGEFIYYLRGMNKHKYKYVGEFNGHITGEGKIYYRKEIKNNWFINEEGIFREGDLIVGKKYSVGSKKLSEVGEFFNSESGDGFFCYPCLDGEGIKYKEDGSVEEGIFVKGEFTKAKKTKFSTITSTNKKPSEKILYKEAFVKLSPSDRKKVQEILKSKGFYKSDIDGLYGAGTVLALKGYNREENFNLKVLNFTVAQSILKKILKEDFANLNCNSDPVSCSTQELCKKATYGPQGKKKWSGHFKNYVRQARRLGLDCGIKAVTAETEIGQVSETEKNIETVSAETKPQMEIGFEQIQALFDAKNYAQAFDEAQLLAIKGNAKAQLLLGKMFAEGRGTIQVNTIAHMWFNIASMGGIDEAYEERQALAKQMTPSSIEQAQKMAMTCIQSKYSTCGTDMEKNFVQEPKVVSKIKQNFELDFNGFNRLRKMKVQFALKELSLYSGVIDGVWGINTDQAVRSYVRDNKLGEFSPLEIFGVLTDGVQLPSNLLENNKSKTDFATIARNKGVDGWFPLTEEPKLGFYDAKEICSAKAELAYRSYQNGNRSDSGSGDIDCYTYGFNSISCSRSSSGGKWAGALEWLEESRNRNAGKKVAHAAAKACMAEFDWILRK